MTPRVLTVGAYERDNFGDLLFFHLTKSYLTAAGFDVVAGSIMPAVIPGQPAIAVSPWSRMLTAEKWHAVWVVGGEVGGVRVDGALGMSLPDGEREIFQRASETGKSFVARFLGQDGHQSMAYLPDLSAYPVNMSTPLLVNSVGISNLGFAQDRDAAAQSDAILMEAAHIHVRDRPSVAYAEEHGITVSSGPDMVHAISLIDGFRIDQLERERAEPYALLQINTELIANYGGVHIAAEIARLANHLGMDVVLFAAGTAHAHDSIAQYFRIAAIAQDSATDYSIDVLAVRDTKRLVGYIAHASIWIGTSLHGRIISSSFTVPRVTLENDKVSRYASTWDPAFPAGVSPVDMLDAADAALAAIARDEEEERSRRLAGLANENTLAMIGHLT